MKYHAESPAIHSVHEAGFGDRLDAIGWGVLLIMTGAIWLVPEEQIPQGTWLIGTGVLLLVLNAIRYLNGLGVRMLMVFLGALALAAGMSDYLGVRLPLLAIAFIVIGASIIFRPLVTRHR